MKRNLKTLTLCDSSGNPTIITCRGHVSFKEFNSAVKREWNTDPYPKEDMPKMLYKYYIPHKTKAWKMVDGNTKGGRKFTVMPWD